MNNTLPDPKTIVDSIADGVVEAAEVVPRCAQNVAGVAMVFADSVKANMEDVKNRMPDDPSVIPDATVKAVGQTVNVGLGMVDAVGKGILDSFDGVRNQILRVTT